MRATTATAYSTTRLTIRSINMEKTLFRSQVLDELDVRFRPDGRRRIFSIKFVTAEGKLIYFPQAYACGAGRMNWTEWP